MASTRSITLSLPLGLFSATTMSAYLPKIKGDGGSAAKKEMIPDAPPIELEADGSTEDLYWDEEGI